MRVRTLRSVLLVLVLAGVTPPLHATDLTIAPGIDLWKTAAENPTKDHLSLPAGFFKTGSDAVDQDVSFTGVPLEVKPGTASLKPADTVLQRLETADLTLCGSPVEVGLRIAAVHLAGQLTVTYGGGSPETWTVDAYLSDAAQATGSLTLRQECADGGSFASSFTVRPKLVFTAPGGTPIRTLDWSGADNLALPFSASGHWATHAPAGVTPLSVAAGAVVDANHDGNWEDLAALPATTGNFLVGVKASPCSCSGSQVFQRAAAVVEVEPIDEKALLAAHGVGPGPAPCEAPGSFPQHRRRDRDRPGHPTDGGQTAGAQLIRFLPLSLLALAVVIAIPWRRKNRD